MALIAKSKEYVILCAKRQIFVFNTNDRTHTSVQVPQIPRKRVERNGSVDEKGAADQEKNEKENNDAEATEQGDNEGFGDINRLAISPCNNLVAVTTVSDKFLFLYRRDDGALNLLHSYQLGRATSAIRFTPDSKHLLIADKTGDCYSYGMEDVPNNEAIWILGHLSIVLDILMSSDSKFIITSDRDEKIRITNYPQSEVVESYCLGHLEFVSAIEELAAAPSNDRQLVSLSGDRTLRLWNYLNGSEVFRLELSGRGIQMAQNGQNELAAVLFDENYTIGVFEVFTSDENKQAVRLVAEHPCENVKYISSIMYETNDSIWYAGLDENEEILLKRLQVNRENGTTSIEEDNVDDLLKILKQNLTSCKLQANDDISQLFKKSFDNVADYHERKKLRMELQMEKKYGK